MTAGMSLISMEKSNALEELRMGWGNSRICGYLGSMGADSITTKQDNREMLAGANT